MSQRLKMLLAEARAWCDAEYGRRSELARLLGVSRQAISAWFSPNQKKSPTADQALELAAFLKSHARKERKPKQSE
jgi:transcriptional regulator with XRE-family HTH domain